MSTKDREGPKSSVHGDLRQRISDGVKPNPEDNKDDKSRPKDGPSAQEAKNNGRGTSDSRGNERYMDDVAKKRYAEEDRYSAIYASSRARTTNRQSPDRRPSTYARRPVAREDDRHDSKVPHRAQGPRDLVRERIENRDSRYSKSYDDRHNDRDRRGDETRAERRFRDPAGPTDRSRKHDSSEKFLSRSHGKYEPSRSSDRFDRDRDRAHNEDLPRIRRRSPSPLPRTRPGHGPSFSRGQKRLRDEVSPLRGRTSERRREEKSPSFSREGSTEGKYPSHSHNVRRSRDAQENNFSDRIGNDNEKGRNRRSISPTDNRPRNLIAGQPRMQESSRDAARYRNRSRDSSVSDRIASSNDSRLKRERVRSPSYTDRRSTVRGYQPSWRSPTSEPQHRRNRGRSPSFDRADPPPRRRSPTTDQYKARLRSRSRSPSIASRFSRAALPDQFDLAASIGSKRGQQQRHIRTPSPDREHQSLALRISASSNEARSAGRDDPSPSQSRLHRRPYPEGDSRSRQRSVTPVSKSNRPGGRSPQEPDCSESLVVHHVSNTDSSSIREFQQGRTMTSATKPAGQENSEQHHDIRNRGGTSRDMNDDPSDVVERSSFTQGETAKTSNGAAEKAKPAIGFRMSAKKVRGQREVVSVLDSDHIKSGHGHSTVKSSGRTESPIKKSRSDTAHQQFETPESIPTPHSAKPKLSVKSKNPANPNGVKTSPKNPESVKHGAQDSSIYERLGQVGEGTYGKVYKARHRNTNEYVALKRIRLEQERDGFPITSMREIKLLQRLKHAGIVKLLEMMIERGSVYMVLEYMDHDLTGVLANPNITFEPPHIKDLAYQLFEGLAYLHHRGVLHRDIKGSNILLNNAGELKLADFGLARLYHKSRKTADYTNRVITLWFRPPELLLGATAYDAGVDVWSAGCIFIELFTRTTIFPGRDEIHQLETIYQVMGSPTTETWPGLSALPWFELIKFHRFEPQFAKQYKGRLSPAALDLSRSILQLDPAKRPVASTILRHPYFLSEEPAAERRTLTDIAESHEWDTKQRRRDERARKLKDEKESSAVVEVVKEEHQH